MKYPIVILLLILGGCATFRDSVRPRLAPTSSGVATIYLIRDIPRKEARIYANERRLILIQDQFKTEPIYTWLQLAPGRYRIAIYPLTTDWKGDAAAASTLDLEGGRNYYVRVDWFPKPEPSFKETITSPSILLAPLIEPIVGRKPYAAPGLVLFGQKDAEAIIAHCRLVDPVE